MEGSIMKDMKACEQCRKEKKLKSFRKEEYGGRSDICRQCEDVINEPMDEEEKEGWDD